MARNPFQVIRDTISIMIRCSAFTAGFRIRYLAGILLGALYALVFTASTAMLMQILLDRVQFRNAEDLHQVALIIVLILVGMAAMDGYFIGYNLGYLRCRISCAMRMALHSHILRLPHPLFEKQSPSDLMSRMTNDLTATENFLAQDLVYIIIAPVVEAVGCCLLLYLISPVLMGTCLVIGGLSFFCQNRYLERVNRIAVDLQRTRSKAMAIVLSMLDGMHTIRVFLLQPIILRYYDRVNRRLSALDAVRTTTCIKQTTLGVAFENIKDFLVLGLGVYYLSHGALTIGGLFAAIQYAGVVFGMFREISEGFAKLQSASVSAKRILDILDLTAENVSEENYTHPVSDSISSGNTVLALHGVSFQYENKPILCNISMDVEKGDTIVFSGPSGSGKSTLLRLLLGLRDDYEGSIRLAGHELRDWPQTMRLEQFAYVPQTPYLFYGSIRDNIIMGNADVCEEAIYEAACAAAIHEEIMAFPNGYETCVGEKGGRLSGGQRQRIGLARALLRKAPILLMDEPTAHLDTRTESLIQEYLSRKETNPTVMVVTHRPWSVMAGEKHYWIDAGKVEEKAPSQDYGYS